jgi:hypothetical protein
MVASCGGNIVGDWQIVSSCVKSSGTVNLSGCTSPATVSASLTVTGTASFRSDLTYTTTDQISGSETIGYPAACLTVQGVTITCDQLSQSFSAGGTTSGACTAAPGGACNCNVTLAAQASGETGTYSTSGGTLTTTPTGSTSGTSGYCVQGNRLDNTPPPGMMSGLTTSGDITLMRQ